MEDKRNSHRKWSSRGRKEKGRGGNGETSKYGVLRGEVPVKPVAFPSSGCECAPFKLGDLGTARHFLNRSFHSFFANINELPIDFHMPDSFGWDFSSA